MKRLVVGILLLSLLSAGASAATMEYSYGWESGEGDWDLLGPNIVTVNDPYAGSSHLEFGGSEHTGQSANSPSISLNDSNVDISLWVREGNGGNKGPDPGEGEELILQYKNGSEWVTAKTWNPGEQSGAYEETVVAIDNVSGSLEYRLVQPSATKDDFWYVDNITVTTTEIESGPVDVVEDTDEFNNSSPEDGWEKVRSNRTNGTVDLQEINQDQIKFAVTESGKITYWIDYKILNATFDEGFQNITVVTADGEREEWTSIQRQNTTWMTFGVDNVSQFTITKETEEVPEENLSVTDPDPVLIGDTSPSFSLTELLLLLVGVGAFTTFGTAYWISRDEEVTYQ